MSFLAASYVVFLIMERETGSKHLQFVSGLKFPLFWIGTYIVDAVSFLIPASLILLCLVVFQVDDFISPDVLAHLALLLAAFGGAVIPYMYVWSYGFTIPATGFTRMTMFNVFTGKRSNFFNTFLQLAGNETFYFMPSRNGDHAHVHNRQHTRAPPGVSGQNPQRHLPHLPQLCIGRGDRPIGHHLPNTTTMQTLRTSWLLPGISKELLLCQRSISAV